MVCSLHISALDASLVGSEMDEARFGPTTIQYPVKARANLIYGYVHCSHQGHHLRIFVFFISSNGAYKS
jgi:hypothetical protein